MPDFSHLARLDVRPDKVERFTFEDIEGEPWFDVRPAGEVNKPYFNELLKRNPRITSQIKARKALTAKAAQELRDLDRELYVSHIIVGWGNVVENSGKKVPFTKENCADFLKQLPNYLFDDLRAFATDIYAFVRPMDPASVDATAKNSPSD